MEIEKKDLMPLSFLKKERYTASFQGMRYFMEKKEEEGANHLLVACWPEPFAFAYTDEEEKSYKSFPFTDEGLEEARLYLMEEWERRKG